MLLRFALNCLVINSEDFDYIHSFCSLQSLSEVFVFLKHKHTDRLVGRARLELATNGLKVRCSTD
jgi:hypothetical protein